MSNPDYQTKVVDNPDTQNSQLALEKIIENAIQKERRRKLDLYQNYSKDAEFKRTFDATIARMLMQSKGDLKKFLTDYL